MKSSSSGNGSGMVCCCSNVGRCPVAFAHNMQNLLPEPPLVLHTALCAAPSQIMEFHVMCNRMSSCGPMGCFRSNPPWGSWIMSWQKIDSRIIAMTCAMPPSACMMMLDRIVHNVNQSCSWNPWFSRWAWLSNSMIVAYMVQNLRSARPSTLPGTTSSV